LSIKIQSLTRKSVKFNKIMAYFIKFCKDSSYQLKLEIDENCLMFVYPVYNALISENVEAKSPKDQEVLFDPNDESLRLSENMMCQTMRFKNKKGSLKKYLKRQTHQNLRKCSEMTCPWILSCLAILLLRLTNNSKDSKRNDLHTITIFVKNWLIWHWLFDCMSF